MILGCLVIQIHLFYEHTWVTRLKIRLVHAGVQETHSFHYHVHQWLFESTDQDSEILDVQAISPQTQLYCKPLYGAGSLQGAIGDAVIHCHLYPHLEKECGGFNGTLILYRMAANVIPNGVPIKAFNRYQADLYLQNQHMSVRVTQILFRESLV